MSKPPDGWLPDAASIDREIDKISEAVDRFAALMKGALIQKAREGRTGWDDPARRKEIASDLIAHAICGEMGGEHAVHAANFAMMLHGLLRPSPRGSEISNDIK